MKITVTGLLKPSQYINNSWVATFDSKTMAYPHQMIAFSIKDGEPLDSVYNLIKTDEFLYVNIYLKFEESFEEDYGSGRYLSDFFGF